MKDDLSRNDAFSDQSGLLMLIRSPLGGVDSSPPHLCGILPDLDDCSLSHVCEFCAHSACRMYV